MAGNLARRSDQGLPASSDWRTSFRIWQERVRDPSLTVLLFLEICVIFVTAPLAVKGLPVARAVGEILILAMVVVVVLLSYRRGAIAVMLLGLVARLASFSLGPEWSSFAVSVLNRGGNILAFSALSWVVAYAVFAPGRITFHRLQGAVVLYLNFASIFASIFSLIWNLDSAAFANVPVSAGGPNEMVTMLYFSLTTMTTTGYGDIVPVDPFARSLANLESILGQFYFAITVTRLVTLELEDHRRR